MTHEVKGGSLFNILSTSKTLISAGLSGSMRCFGINAGAVVNASDERLPSGGPDENGLVRQNWGSILPPGSNQPGRVELAHHPRGTA